ncbi:hypothetical protein SFB93_08645 [Kurthia gibsonii]|uniref:hypothetical protein n=1 Tax=Kurthia gibsonii TaxID=33946 RepID=UPI003982D8FC
MFSKKDYIHNYEKVLTMHTTHLKKVCEKWLKKKYAKKSKILMFELMIQDERISLNIETMKDVYRYAFDSKKGFTGSELIIDRARIYKTPKNENDFFQFYLETNLEQQFIDLTLKWLEKNIPSQFPLPHYFQVSLENKYYSFNLNKWQSAKEIMGKHKKEFSVEKFTNKLTKVLEKQSETVEKKLRKLNKVKLSTKSKLLFMELYIDDERITVNIRAMEDLYDDSGECYETILDDVKIYKDTQDFYEFYEENDLESQIVAYVAGYMAHYVKQANLNISIPMYLGVHDELDYLLNLKSGHWIDYDTVDLV